ncbi:MAG: hypothetical protein RBR69_08900 [Candidatus Cloacimonadaceae bacterium]|nr:hypothetical protein [Candidatus Cloacimonadota bacterium]MCK9243271.1 hypothetical protein [Candidatus Cloacimonadota bacterium]MDY0128231.1 hypothetical protein [Candidatus Cloacimonadaceae bacterium]
MRRCKLCLMPDQLPGSDFDADSVCAWCRDAYPPYVTKGEQILAHKFKGLADHQGAADCLVGLSGGKDSTYALYRLVKHYHLKVEAFIYTHGGSKDFAIQNAKRSCEILDVPYYLVSLPGDTHTQSFLHYFKAWLAHPDSTAAGMTCVACKHLHILGSQIAVRRRIPYVVWASTPLEYSPFLAIKHQGDASHQYKREGMLHSGLQLAREIVQSPRFAQGLLRVPRTSILGCLAVFPNSAYLRFRYRSVSPLMFYSYEKWDPELILDTITSNLDWKIPPEIKEDWHTDCVFNVFKEHMFQKMYGVSYTDSHLSNQIRHGYLSREEARIKLKESKRFYAASILPALQFLKSQALMSQIDLSCFDVDI